MPVTITITADNAMAAMEEMTGLLTTGLQTICPQCVAEANATVDIGTEQTAGVLKEANADIPPAAEDKPKRGRKPKADPAPHPDIVTETPAKPEPPPEPVEQPKAEDDMPADDGGRHVPFAETAAPAAGDNLMPSPLTADDFRPLVLGLSSIDQLGPLGVRAEIEKFGAGRVSVIDAEKWPSIWNALAALAVKHGSTVADVLAAGRKRMGG